MTTGPGTGRVSAEEPKYCATGTAFIEPGVYQTLPCGCMMFALAFDPLGPRMVWIEGPHKGSHTVEEFLPLKYTTAQALALAEA